jgi:hypothetical protein
MTSEEFYNFFRNIYGPLVASHQSKLNLRRYVQSYPLCNDSIGEGMRAARPEIQTPFDGTATFWWDFEDDTVDNLTSETGKTSHKELIECERQFVDLAKSSIFVTKEIPQINPMPENSVLATLYSPIIKCCYPLNFRPELGRDKGQYRWMTGHADLTRRFGEAMYFLRYIQSHTIDSPVQEILRDPRGTMEPYDGITEVWWNQVDLTLLMNTPGSAGMEAFALLGPDEYRFMDISRSSVWFSKEQVFVER